jgi:hypothetical protein
MIFAWIGSEEARSGRQKKVRVNSPPTIFFIEIPKTFIQFKEKYYKLNLR